MPYILMKRNDIPDGHLQILDLNPNTSSKNYIYGPGLGETKYVDAADPTVGLSQSDVVNVGGTVFTTRELTGLGAWWLANVENAGGVSAPVDVVSTVEAIIDLYFFGDLTTPAGVLTLAAINGVVNGTDDITAGQLPDVLDILAGRTYVLPAGIQLGTGGGGLDVQPPLGSPGGPVFGPSNRRGDTGAFKLSFAQGRMAGFLQNDFSYQDNSDTSSEALAVYNNDGTLYTG